MKYREVPREAVPNPHLEHTNDWLLPNYGAAPHGFPPRDLPIDPSPRPVHYYHLYAGELGNGWERVAGEHFQALADAKFPGQLKIGIVGLLPQRIRVKGWLNYTWPGWELATEVDYGYEQVTHQALHAAAQEMPANTPVLYAHTKGGYRVSEHQDLWRRCMQETCVTHWERCVARLAEGFDVCGAHYLIPDGRAVGVPMMAGNYWWATSGYIAGLPKIRYRDRYDAEAWIGLGDARVHDFAAFGWPYHPHELS